MERMRHIPQGIGMYLGKWAINMKQKTATQVRRHAEGKMSCTHQSDEVGPEQIHERIEGVRWQIERESFLRGECSLEICILCCASLPRSNLFLSSHEMEVLKKTP